MVIYLWNFDRQVLFQLHYPDYHYNIIVIENSDVVGFKEHLKNKFENIGFEIVEIQENYDNERIPQ